MTDMGNPCGEKGGSRWLDIFSRSLLYAIGILVLGVCCMYYRKLGWAWTSWDLMLISGLLAFIVALYLAGTIPVRMEQTLVRLVNRSVFVVENQGLTSFQAKIEARAQRFAQVCAFVVGLVILDSFLADFKTDIVREIPLTLAEGIQKLL